MVKQTVVALLSGTLFGTGLAYSGMSDPSRVRAFLDLFGGAWDPTLAFVMAGAILPMSIAWVVRPRVARPLADSRYWVPETTGINRTLIAGAMLFGIGWGIAGLCPGPALADLAIAPAPAATFVVAMIAGMLLHRLIPTTKTPSTNPENSNV